MALDKLPVFLEIRRGDKIYLVVCGNNMTQDKSLLNALCMMIEHLNIEELKDA